MVGINQFKVNYDTSDEIVRAESWDQIFRTPEQEVTAYTEFLQRWGESSSILYSGCEALEDGMLYRFESPYQTNTIQRKPNGDIEIAHYIQGKEPEFRLIETSVGNINHMFSLDSVAVPNWKLLPSMHDLNIPINFIQGIKGKPATREWENVMTESTGTTPLRIGYRLYLPHVPVINMMLTQKFPEAYK